VIDALLTGSLRAVMAAPAPVKRALAGPAAVERGTELDLNTQLLLRAERLLALLTGADVTRSLPAARRALVGASRIAAGPPVAMPVRALTLAGANGPLACRLYTPAQSGAGLLVYFHGGGWIEGNLDTHDAACRTLAQAAGTRIVAVDYRLAPEHPYPAAIDDALAAYRDVVARCNELAVSAEDIAVGGDSAGANIAAVTCMRVRAAMQGPAPAAQLLIYPVTDIANMHDSRRRLGHGLYLTEQFMSTAQALYLGPSANPANPEISPLLAEDLTGLPPAIVVTAGFDPLRDEGEAFAQRLAEAGVPVTERHYPAYVHGFINHLITCSPAVQEIGRTLADVLAQRRAPGLTDRA
jgi:acetyl esterase